mmetsp:Transcript_145982/g.468093  ORF Transcript_145982/g.468093 Transcript_145982/m.468093 type:complete len:328 (+) Transcript_145982:90-1073(+)
MVPNMLVFVYIVPLLQRVCWWPPLGTRRTQDGWIRARAPLELLATASRTTRSERILHIEERSLRQSRKILTRVLSKHVSEGELNGIKSTLVDYQALRRDPSDLKLYLAQLCHLDPGLSAAEALATMINAYNAVMLAMVVHFNPVSSVLEIDNVWMYKFGTVNGSKVSLDDIEHGVIRDRGNGGLAAEFGARGRIHAGVNCASLSCPDLPFEAFEGARLFEQLNAATKKWLTNPTKNPGLAGGALKLSHIFKWYGVDFVNAEGSVQAFVKQHTGWQVADGASLDFIPYDWNLNELNGKASWSGAVEAAPFSHGLCIFVAAIAMLSVPL